MASTRIPISPAPIIDGAGSGDASISNVTKVGSGTLTLTGLNTYAGTTTVQDGILSVTQINTATAGDVSMFGDAVFNLNFAGTDVIDSLFFDGVSQAVGLWGRLGNAGATFTSAFFTGDGLLQVSTLGPNLGAVGDYNGDGIVNAADYTTWRNNLGGPGTALLNRDPANGTGVVGPGDYTSWKTNFREYLPRRWRGRVGGRRGARAGELAVDGRGARGLLLQAAAKINKNGREVPSHQAAVLTAKLGFQKLHLLLCRQLGPASGGAIPGAVTACRVNPRSASCGTSGAWCRSTCGRRRRSGSRSRSRTPGRSP